MPVEPEVEQARLKLAAIALAMLTGTISFIEGARQIVPLARQAKLDDFDPDIVPFICVDSETDAFPFNQVRAHWAPDALAKFQPEIELVEKWAGDFCREHCQKLIDRFKPSLPTT